MPVRAADFESAASADSAKARPSDVRLCQLEIPLLPRACGFETREEVERGNGARADVGAGAITAESVARQSGGVEAAKCVRCGEAKPKSDFYRRAERHCGVQSYCRKCHCAYYRARREADPDRFRARRLAAQATPEYRAWRKAYIASHRKKHPEQGRAHKAVRLAKKRGVLRIERCAVCGATERLHAHHESGYEHALDVVALCPLCHARRHASLRDLPEAAP